MGGTDTMTDLDLIHATLYATAGPHRDAAIEALRRVRAALGEREAEIERLRSDLTTYIDAATGYVTEIERLRADPNRLDLASVPEGWTFDALINEGNVDGCFSVNLTSALDMVDGIGPTPAAALADAVSQTKKPSEDHSPDG